MLNQLSDSGAHPPPPLASMYRADVAHMSADALYARQDMGLTTTPECVPRQLSAASRDTSNGNIYDSLEAYLYHHGHVVQDRHAVSRVNAPLLVPEALLTTLVGTPVPPACAKRPVPPVPAETRAAHAQAPPQTQTQNNPKPFPLPELETQTTQELEERCAELNDRAVMEAQKPHADAPVTALRLLKEAHQVNARVQALLNAAIVAESNVDDESNTHIVASQASATRRRAAVDAALHANTADILLDSRLLDRKLSVAFAEAPRHALQHALKACDADLLAGADAESAAFSIDLAARAFEAFGRHDEAALHRQRAEAVRVANRRSGVE